MNDLPTTLRQIADDIENRPDERCWEWSFSADQWWQCVPRQAFNRINISNMKVRRKPETITRTITYPKPVSEPLSLGQKYWVTGCIRAFTWTDCSGEQEWLKQGRIHLTKKDKDEHEQALWGEDDE